ncbi:MAG: ADP-ribosylation factor-like protein [Candidatus Hodarchaeales archaeon]|jgi:GTPase SAR1 family protein
MSEWVSESEVSLRLGYKVLLAGLSEAGKTAVKRVFFLKQSAKDVDDLAATINYERLIANIGDTTITIVDLGGQRVFLKRFLGSFSPFIFSAVKAFLFLIDVENKATRNSAIEYFSHCLEKLQIYSPNAEYFVFLHKNDLVQHLPNYDSIHEQLKEQFQLESPKKVSFFRTTIFRPETVIDGFGRIFELGMPELAQSDYVDGREIGQVEEYTEEFVTFREPAVQEELISGHSPDKATITTPNQAIAASSIPAKNAGDPATLAKLQNIMKAGMKAGTGVLASSDPSAVSSDSGGTAELQTLMRSALKPELDALPSSNHSLGAPSRTMTAPKESSAVEGSLARVPSKVERLTEDHLDLLHSIDEATEELVIDEPAAEEVVKPEDGKKSRVDFLASFFGIQLDEAKAVVESGYADVFEIAATSRIPIPLILTVVLKYIPLIKSKGLDVETLDKEKLLGTLAEHLKGSIRENDILQVLTVAAKRIDLTIAEIIDKHSVGRPKKVPTVRIEAGAVTEHPVEPIELPVRVEPESPKEIISFPSSPEIGFKAELTPELNCRLFFYSQSQLISNVLVSGTITRDEIMYLLHYEVQLSLEGGATSIYHASRLIHDTIKKVRGEG